MKNKLHLDDLNKQRVFSVPDGYFEQLPTQIQQRVTSQTAKRSVFSLSWVRYGVSFAGVLLVLLTGYLFYPTSDGASSVQPQTTLADVSDEEIIQYLQQADLSQAELIEIAGQTGVMPESSLPDKMDAETIEDAVDAAFLEEYM